MPEVPQAGPVEDKDTLDIRQLVLDLEELVELLFILGKQEPAIGVCQRMFDLPRLVGRIDAVNDTAGEHGANIRPQPLAAVLALDRDDVAAFETERQQAPCNLAGALSVVGPGIALPDTEVFLPHRDAVTTLGRYLEKQLGQRVAALDEHLVCTHRHVFRFFQRRRPRTPSSFLPR